MADYVTVEEFADGWNFFAVKMVYNNLNEKKWGKFPCSDFSCSGCDDWLDCDNQNRKVHSSTKLSTFDSCRSDE